MTDLRQLAIQLQRFRFRLVAALGFVFFCFSLLLARFVYLQIIRYEDYRAQAEDNRISIVPITPNRGLILDRNGIVLARNYSAYTLEITPSKLQDELDFVIDELAKIIDIQPRDRKRFKKLAEESKSFESLPIRTRLSDEEVARFAAHRYRFPGVDIKARLFRDYPLGELASHVVGYIGRISQKDKERIEEWDDAENYAGTTYIGKEGLEKRYEKELHGLTGYEEVEVSAGGRAIRTLSRSPAQPGNNLILSIDVRLQELAEQAFGDRKGALVAIEPETGDVLAFVSKPTFDPNLFVDGIDPENWKALNESADRPLINRPLTGTYPIGSTFKPFMALAALETGKRTPGQAISDPGFFQFGNHRFRDDKVGGHGYVDMYKSIVVSCDTYYYVLARDMGIQLIHDFMKPLGFGQITGIDLDGERRGILPSPEWKKKAYRKPEQQRWYEGETISIGIGQGYNSFTILQLAHATANLANYGVVMKPHLVKTIHNIRTNEKTLTVPKESYRIPLKPENVEVIHKALVGVAREGTSARAFAGTEYVSAGKTGTAQVIGIKQNEKYDAKKIASQYHDHALYMAFAPADKPKIALAVIVENGGFGAQAAAPIARQVFDFWLLGKRPAVPKAGEKTNGAPVVEVTGD
jgi:penicillin-binding protein 2